MKKSDVKPLVFFWTILILVGLCLVYVIRNN